MAEPSALFPELKLSMTMNKNCVRFAADLARKEPAQGASEIPDGALEIMEEVVLSTDN
jgi:hypothetical protein